MAGSEERDRELAAAALRKRQAGRKPIAALYRFLRDNSRKLATADPAAVSEVNHYLDVCYMACVAGYLCGVRLIEQEPAPAGQTEVVASTLRTPDGRAFLASER